MPPRRKKLGNIGDTINDGQPSSRNTGGEGKWIAERHATQQPGTNPQDRMARVLSAAAFPKISAQPPDRPTYAQALTERPGTASNKPADTMPTRTSAIPIQRRPTDAQVTGRPSTDSNSRPAPDSSKPAGTMPTRRQASGSYARALTGQPGTASDSPAATSIRTTTQMGAFPPLTRSTGIGSTNRPPSEGGKPPERLQGEPHRQEKMTTPITPSREIGIVPESNIQETAIYDQEGQKWTNADFEQARADPEQARADFERAQEAVRRACIEIIKDEREVDSRLKEIIDKVSKEKEIRASRERSFIQEGFGSLFDIPPDDRKKMLNDLKAKGDDARYDRFLRLAYYFRRKMDYIMNNDDKSQMPRLSEAYKPDEKKQRIKQQDKTDGFQRVINYVYYGEDGGLNKMMNDVSRTAGKIRRDKGREAEGESEISVNFTDYDL